MHGYGRAVLVAAGLSLLGGSAVLRGAERVQKGDVVAVSGDSITEQKEYSAIIEAYLMACLQDGPVRTAQFGWSGDSMGYLWSRGGPAPVLAIKPTVVTTCYGMNDGGYKPVEPATINAYRDGMVRLVQEYKKNGVRMVVVGSPGAVDTQTFRQDPAQAAMYNPTLAALRDVARDVAQQEGCVFANVHDPMMQVMEKAKAKYGPNYHVCGGDGVHPGGNGHLVMAYAFLKALGCDGNIGTITLDLASNKASATAGHKVLGSQAGTVSLESTRYPFCFYGDPADPGATTGIIEFFPFNEDLNRFKLVVTGTGGKRDAMVRVTWGQASKEFTAEALAKGINLAAEFLNNPFSEPFQKLRTAVRNQQEWETPFYKTYLTALTSPGLRQELQADPDDGVAGLAGLDRMTRSLCRKDAKLAAGVAAGIAPVQHAIKVELVK
jgi:lysophospholipase L1-like esterase